MRNPTMKCPRWCLQWRSRLICVPAAMLFLVLSAQSQDRIPRSLPEVPVGGWGGGEFVARCPPGQLLGGVELRVGDDVDAIRPLCRTPSVHVEMVEVMPYWDRDGKLVARHDEKRETYYVSDATATTGWYGGPGGSIKTLVCSPGAGGIAVPVVSGIYVEAEGFFTFTVNRITLLCEGLTGGGLPTEFRDREFWKDMRSDDRTVKNFEAPKSQTFEVRGTSICPVSRDNLATLAVGIHGRSGKRLDAVGLICDEAKLPPAPVKAIGRVKGGAPTGPPRPICEVAREARARNSPAAPGLEAQCRAAGAAGEVPPVKAIGRVKGAPTGPPRPICEVAREARARNSPAAPGLEAQCRAAGAAGEAPAVDMNDLAARGEAIANADPLAVELRNQQPEGPTRRGFDIGLAAAEWNTAPGPGKQKIHDLLNLAEQGGFDTAVSFSLEHYRNALNDLAAKGEAIANEDPLAAELRNQYPEGPARRGFDIGMAAAEGQTAPGPGKQKIHDALSPAEQGGFTAAVSFSLERNRNKDLAETGAKIADADQVVADARNTTTDVFYRLGFDIATAIFGNPALGAQGNTATEPGSLGIRDSLSAAGQRGFNASVKFHLSRNYKP